jgi:pyruvate/2-oxoglutarate dehydrogenase complex dihydrolipoamide dehydrogenase (E3) component
MVDVIVIGGGPAGVTAALRASELGKKVALVERDRLGGTCTNDGCVPTRVLAKAARLVRDAEQFSEYGIQTDLPQVDFSRLMGRVQQVVYSIHEKKQLIKSLTEAGVEVITGAGAARVSDPHTLQLQSGASLQADKFILAVGGHARRINFPGAEHTLTHSDVWSLRDLPRSLVIVGGAATGCQVASIFTAFGTQVWILEVGPNLLGREDEMIAHAVAQSFERRGIRVVTGISGVERVEKTTRGLTLYYKKEGEVLPLTSEAVLVAVGWPGNVDDLNLQAAGVQVERGYVVTNDYFQTSAEHIFAAGDITGKMMLVQSAGFQARLAAENAVMGVGEKHRHLIVPHGGFTDPEYGSVGLTEAEARALGEVVVGQVSYAEMDRAVIDGHTEGSCKLIVSQETHRLVGAHVVGEQALEIIHLVAGAMTGDVWIEQLAELEIAYPTFTAIVGVAARRIVRELGVMPLSPEWRILGKPHISEWERRVE